jgi:hypothetical protein
MKRLFLFAPALLAACGGGGQTSVSLSARAGPQLAAAAPAPAPAGISITRVRVALRRIELRSTDGDRRAEIEQGPLVVDLSGAQLDGGVHQVLDAQVPPGTYEKIELEIEPVAALDGASIVVDGAFQGNGFEFSSGIEAEQEREGNFTITDRSANITLDLDPASWFVQNGAAIDPRDPANRAAIEAKLASALNAFRDDDHSGRDDEEEADDDHGGNRGPGGGTDDR